MYVLKMDFAHLMGWPTDWAKRLEYQAKALEMKKKISDFGGKTHENSRLLRPFNR